MNHKKPTQKLIDATRIYYFIRKHGSIGRLAEQAGIKLKLGENKIENLIKIAHKYKGGI